MKNCHLFSRQHTFNIRKIIRICFAIPHMTGCHIIFILIHPVQSAVAAHRRPVHLCFSVTPFIIKRAKHIQKLILSTDDNIFRRLCFRAYAHVFIQIISCDPELFSHFRCLQITTFDHFINGIFLYLQYLRDFYRR